MSTVPYPAAGDLIQWGTSCSVTSPATEGVISGGDNILAKVFTDRSPEECPGFHVTLHSEDWTPTDGIYDFFARVKFGYRNGGIQGVAEVDMGQGQAFYVPGSFVEIAAFAQVFNDAAPAPPAALTRRFGAVVTPAKGGPAGWIMAQRTIHCGRVNNAAVSATLKIPAYARLGRAHLGGSAGTSLIQWFADSAAAISVGSTGGTTSPGGFHIPNTARFFTASNGGGAPQFVSAMFDLAL
jgi:hypothetical protein